MVGPPIGKGAETRLRFDLGMPKAKLAETVARLQEALADLQ